MKRILFITLIVLMASIVTKACEDTTSNVIDAKGIKQGYWVTYSKNNIKLREGNYIDGLRDGVWIFYRSNGSLESKYTFVKGVEHGMYQTYRETGELHGQGNYTNGKIDGEFLGFDLEGKIACKLLWEHGILVKEEVLVPNAKPTGTIEEINGKKYYWNFGERQEVKIISDTTTPAPKKK